MPKQGRAIILVGAELLCPCSILVSLYRLIGYGPYINTWQTFIWQTYTIESPSSLVPGTCISSPAAKLARSSAPSKLRYFTVSDEASSAVAERRR
jgi:hypothetical protein